MESVLVRTKSRLLVKRLLPCIEYRRLEDGTIEFRLCDEQGNRFGDVDYSWHPISASALHDLLSPDEFSWRHHFLPALTSGTHGLGEEFDGKHVMAATEWLRDAPVKIGDCLVTVERIER